MEHESEICREAERFTKVIAESDLLKGHYARIVP